MINNQLNLSINVSHINKQDIVNLITCYSILTAGKLVSILDNDRNKTFCIIGDGKTETRDLPIYTWEHDITGVSYVSTTN